MNEIHLNGKVRGSEKAVPGCLGRMVNLFDLTSGVAGNRLLTDKPHNDGSLSRSRSDVSRMSTVAGDEMEDKVMVSELKKTSPNTKPYGTGTPVKMLIAQEMSKDLELRHNNTPNLVAKLMGLDALPKQQPPKSYNRKSHSEIPVGYWQEEVDSSELHSHQMQNECKDIHEILQQSQSQRTHFPRDKSPQKGRSNEKVNDKRLALIRQKFMEAKRLATDEKLRQTKEFQEALDVLSSNGDLFLKVLQEPNSLFSDHLNGVQGVQASPLSPETKRITVLRPSKMMINEKQVKKPFHVSQVNLWENHPNGFSPTISTTQPTRIVVLKPGPGKGGPGKGNVPKTGVSSTPSSPRAPKSENFFVEPEDEEAREAREVAKEITQQMRENLAGHRRNETLLSSVFSNGFTGDESSFEKSENEFAVGNLSDSEVLSPTSRHSWDYVNRFGSPYSVSSISRASFSPESSVCREAKKRLSERWAMMASNGSIQEQRPFRSSSSTLGEMLALSEIKKPEICEEEVEEESEIKAENPRASTSFLNNSVSVEGDESPRNFSRSKSVPVSSAVYAERRLSVEVPKDVMKTKTPKTSFAGKVTSLFFSKNRKSRKDNNNNNKPSSLRSTDEFQSVSDNTPGLIPPLGSRLNNDNSRSEAALPPSELHTGTISLDKRGFHQGACVPGILGENLDQPSPISVLEQTFEEEGVLPNCSRSFDPYVGRQPALGLSKSNLIDKSPPIGSIARTLSWDECCTETATNYPLNSPFVSPGPEDDEGEWLYLVQSLLTMAGLDDEGPTMARWHSPESPLDPLLREKYVDLTTKEPLHEAKRRQLRSTRKLVFDSVNSALIDIISGFSRTPSTRLLLSSTYVGHGESGSHGESSGPTLLADRVWEWMKEWLSIEGGDSNSLVEKWVMKEVVGPGWTNLINVEIDHISQEIEGKMLEELVEESVVQWTGRD